MRYLALAILISSALIGASPASAAQASQVMSAEQVRQDLMDFVAMQEKMLALHERLNGSAPYFALSIQQQFQAVSQLSNDDLLSIAAEELPLGTINAELSRMIGDLSRSTPKIPSATAQMSWDPVRVGRFPLAPVTSGAPHLGDNCSGVDADGKNGEVLIGSIRYPPGPCNQVDEIPTTFNPNDGSRNFEEFRLSDVQYPTLCPINTNVDFILGNEIALQVLRTVETLAKLLCDQEVAGFNSATVCTPFTVALELTEQLFGPLKYCNGARRNADGTAIYIRTGEIFVQSNAHYAALNARSSETNTKIGRLESEVSVEVRLYGSEVSDELQSGLDSVDERMDALDQKIQENAVRADFARLNNEEIVREIRIQKARILEDLLD